MGEGGVYVFYVFMLVNRMDVGVIFLNKKWKKKVRGE